MNPRLRPARPAHALLAAVFLLVAIPAAAQFEDPDALYDAGSLRFDYAQTPFPIYSGSFAAEGPGLQPDGTLPPGADQAVGGGSAPALEDTVGTVAYAVTANADGTYDAALIALKSVGPLAPGSFEVDLSVGTAIFGYLDDAENFDLPDTLDQDSLLPWLQDLPAAHKLISYGGTITVEAVSADTLRGTFDVNTLDIDDPLFLVNVSGGEFALSGADQVTPAPAAPAAVALDAWPNPFNPRTTVSLAVPRTQPVAVAVYDLAGRHVRTLHRGSLAAGEQRLTWHGLRQDGERAAAGVYLVRARGGGWQQAVKVTLAP
jgi:hypothetical protein